MCVCVCCRGASRLNFESFSKFQMLSSLLSLSLTLLHLLLDFALDFFIFFSLSLSPSIRFFSLYWKLTVVVFATVASSSNFGLRLAHDGCGSSLNTWRPLLFRVDTRVKAVSSPFQSTRMIIPKADF